MVNADMGRAIQRTSSQHLLSSNMSQTQASETYTALGTGLPTVTEEHEFWQDRVRAKLTTDLADYGIQLVRLNIEEAKILDPDLESEMAMQAKTVAKAEAELAALGTKKLVQEQSLALKEAGSVKVAQIEQQANMITAETKFELMQQDATTKLKVSRIDAERSQVESTAKAGAIKREGQALEDCPAMLQLQMAEQYAGAIQGGSFSSSMPLADLWAAFCKMLHISQGPKKVSQAELLTKHSPFMRRAQSCGGLSQMVGDTVDVTPNVL